MKYLKLFESQSEESLLNNPDYPDADEIIDYLINRVDRGDITIIGNPAGSQRYQEHLHWYWGDRDRAMMRYNYHKNLPFEKHAGLVRLGEVEPNHTDATVLAIQYLQVEIPHPEGIRGNLFLDGYTHETLQSCFKKFVLRSGHLVNIKYKILGTNTYHDPLSESLIRIEFLKNDNNY